jgi:predicted naringenin-chalcone synthase
LAYLEEKNENKVNKEFLIKRIIFGSFSSLIISDINSGTRDYIRKIDKDIFSKIQQKGFDYILSKDAPEYIKKDLKETLDNKSNELELLIIKIAKKYA